ncbi:MULTISPECIES: PAS domain-containing protein [unclassified Sulfuricurvum]|uniref:PAS domain-containing protein n=1 Tax=unclassified Sulfuricurvum TaxID=2632390 RepID=UPI000AEF9E19|nr:MULTISPECIES: PAS domain-containing protein [unclassified Sulfuricurvum]
MSREYVLKETDFLVFQTDAQGKILFANEDYCHISGYGLDELIGKPENQLYHPDMPESVCNHLRETAKKGYAWNGYLKKRTKDEGFYWVFAMLFPMSDDSHNATGYTMCCRKPSPEEIRSAWLLNAAV